MAVLHLVVLAAVLGWGGKRRETPVSKGSRHLAYGPERWTGAGGSAGNVYNLGPVSAQHWPQCTHLSNGERQFCWRWAGGARMGGQTHFDELHVQLGVLLHVLQQVSMECLHLCGVQGGVDQGDPIIPRPRCSIALCS